MNDRTRIGLDNPAFSGRLRPAVSPTSEPAATTLPPTTARPLPVSLEPEDKPIPQLSPMLTVPEEVSLPTETSPEPSKPVSAPETPEDIPSTASDPVPAPQPEPDLVPPPLPIVQAAPFVQPAQPKAQPSKVLHRQSVKLPPAEKIIQQLNPRHYTKTQLMMVSLAALTFIVGIAVSLQTVQTNQAAMAKVLAMSSQEEASPSEPRSEDAAPDTGKLSDQTVAAYTVAPDLARYVRIPKFNINARVLQSNMKSNGSIETPDNIHDTAWYTGSSRPGELGATLISGYASGGVTQGALFNAKLLVAGDVLEIVRGDGSVVSYRVVKTQNYSAKDVDMVAAMTAVNPDKSGLNLLVYGGRSTPGSSEYTQRIIIFAEQI